MSLLLSSFYPNAVLNAVLTTGNQNISGIKTFNETTSFTRNISLNRSTVFGSNETQEINFDNQARIKWYKDFDSLEIFAPGGSPGAIEIKNGSQYIKLNGDDDRVIYSSPFHEFYGDTWFNQRPKVNGTGVLLQGEAAGTSLSTFFNGNRQIKAIPVVNTNYGGTTISGFLENMFFPYQDATISLSEVPIFTYGINTLSSFAFAGSITRRDDIITGIAYRSGNLILSGPFARTTEGSYSTVPVPTNTFRESSPEIFNVQLFVTKNGQPETRISNNARLRFEPRYFYGVSSNPNLETGITQLTAPPVNAYTYPFGSKPASVTHTGFSPNAQYIYFAYPSPNTTQDNIINWGNTLSSIFDTNANFEYIGQYTQLTPVTINFIFKSLQYRIYRSNDLITLAPNQSLTLRFTFGA
jgi:hypothetical protein